MRRHLIIGAVLIVLSGGGVAWQVHGASNAALAKGDRPTFVCPLAGHPGTR
jgi:hypothetical protein